MANEDAEYDSVGRYGTIALLKRNEPSVVVTAFGIETEEVTFGRDPSCSVRLYYPDVSPLHCKIIFEDRKAFLEVHGASGLTVDGCAMRPKSASSPAIVSMSNNSIFEIRQKSFRFSYPPKELRAQLFASPAPDNRRKLRMSMIQSAQVFSPHPSPDPKQNLRVLQSPLKPFHGREPAQPSPLKASLEHADESEVVVLVEGNHPRVVQEDNDLVILERIDEEPPSSPKENAAFSLPPANRVPQTPQRRAGRPTLHKAVLIRSAQRAVFRAEVEDAEEEEEVLDTIVAEADSSDSSEEEEQRTVSASEPNEEPQPEASGWLGRIWPFRASVSPPKQPAQLPKEEEQEQELRDDRIDIEEEQEEQEPNPFSGPSRPLKSFMTPQAKPSGINFAGARRSLGGQQARIKLEMQDAPAWRVRDITVSPAKVEVSSPIRGAPRESVTEEERKAIKERRKSVHKTPDPFFGGNIPGMSPSKSRIIPPDSPTKLLRVIAETAEDKEEDEEQDAMDYQEMLQNIKRTTDFERQNLMSAKQRRLSTFTPGPNDAKTEDAEPMQGVESTPEDDEEEQMRRLREGVEEEAPMQVDEPQQQELIREDNPMEMSSARRVAEALLEASNPSQRSKATEESPSLADDEATPGNTNATKDDEDDEPMDQEEKEIRPKSRLLRGKTPPPSNTNESKTTRGRSKPSETTTSSIKPPSATRKPASKSVITDEEDAAPVASRPKRAQKPPPTTVTVAAAKRTTRRTNGGESSADESAGPSKPAVRKTAARKKPAGTVSSDDESSTAPSTRSTRGRKAAAPAESAVELETVNEEEPEEPKAKRGRPRKAPVKEEEEEPVAVAAPAKSTRAKKVTEPPVPLAERKNKPVAEAPAPAKATRSRKAAVKEEVMTEPEMRPRTTRATRSRTKTVE